MLNKILSLLGFNSGDSLIGLTHLNDNNTEIPTQANQIKAQKEVKLSDLMRGA